MPGIGANGSVTTFPANGEKVCAGCEHWRGYREVTYSGSCATTPNGQAARCVKKNANTLIIIVVIAGIGFLIGYNVRKAVDKKKNGSESVSETTYNSFRINVSIC